MIRFIILGKWQTHSRLELKLRKVKKMDYLLDKVSAKQLRLMEEDINNEDGKEIRANHAKLQELILREDFDSSYIDDFIHHLQTLLK